MADHDEPLDLAAIQVDDELLDRIGRGGLILGDDELTGVLVEWRKKIHEGVPTVELCDIANQLAALREPRMPWWRRVKVWFLTRAIRLLTPPPR